MAPPRKRSRAEPAISPPLPSSHILPPSPQLSRILLKLSKPSLISLVSKWVENDAQSKPDLTPTEDDLYDNDEAPDLPIEDVMDAYNALKTRKAIVERIFEREWRHGLTLLQVAQADVQVLYDQPSSHKWTVAELTICGKHASKNTNVPRFQPKTFMLSLQGLIHSMAQCHYHIIQHPTLPLHLVRLSLYPPHPLPTIPSPAVTYYAFPSSSPHVFFTPNPNPLAQIAHKSLPIALSSQHQRYDLTNVGLGARTLETLVAMKGHGRGAMNAGGAWSVYKIEGDDAVDANPLDGEKGRRKRAREDDYLNPDKENRGRKLGKLSLDTDDDGGKRAQMKKKENEERIKRRKIAEGRFGESAKEDDGAGLERAEFHVRERFPRPTPLRNQNQQKQAKSKKGKQANTRAEDGEGEGDWPVPADWRPAVSVLLEGTHVFAGARRLVEEGVWDGIKLPNFMTGEEGRSIGVIRDGKLVKRDITSREERYD